MEKTPVPILHPVAGGRMLAKVDGQVVFVAGAIPGEEVTLRVTRATKHALWADVVEVAPPYDPAGVTALAGATLAYDLLSLLALARARRGA